MKIFFLAFILIVINAHSQSVRLEESTLMQACTKQDLPACERLGAYYIKLEKWDKAIIVGKALCEKALPIGCTYVGISLLAKKNVSEGNNFLIQACDKFEPFACRSLGRLMKSAGEADLSHLYFKRACHYGLKEVCSDLKRGRVIFSSAGLEFIKKVQVDCEDSKSIACSERLSSITICASPLTKQDCLLLPGHLSIYFRAKLMQSEAKLSLLSLVAAEKRLKEDPKVKTYSHDLVRVLKDYKPLNNYHYVFGFMNACSGKAKSTSIELFPESYSHLASKTISQIHKYFSKGKKSECYEASGGFDAFAVANLDPLNQLRLDVWKINQDGNLLQVEDGLPLP